MYNKSLAISSLILLGIIVGIRYIFELLGYWLVIFRYLNNDYLFFALMVTLLYPFLKIFFDPFGRSAKINVMDIVERHFKKFFKFFIIGIWIIAGLFLSIDLLQIEKYEVDVFYLSFLWIFATVLIDTIITSLFNRMRSKEKRLPKNILRYSEVTGLIIASVIWSIQLFVFEIYLKRFFGIDLFEQDIRILFGIVSLIYFVVVYSSLKYKFLPDAMKESQEVIAKALALKEEEVSTITEIDRTNKVLDVKDLTTYFYTEEGVVKAVEGISFQIFNLSRL